MKSTGRRLLVDLTDQHALITGGGGGIGRVCALSLAAAGAAVSVLDQSQQGAEATCESVTALGVDAWAWGADVRDAEQVAEVVSQTHRNHPLSICVNAAGLNRTGPAEAQAVEEMRLVLDVNVLGTMLCCSAFGRTLLADKLTGSIVNVSSQMGRVGYPGRSAYCCSKHAVNGYTKALGVEWAERGIRVNAVAPTFVDTPLTKPMFQDEAFHADVLRRIPMGRIGQVEEVADAVLFLASPAASLITGEILYVDGGWTAW